MTAAEVLAPYLKRWRLAPDGEPFVTRAAVLLPVRSDGSAAMLKVATADEERRGAALLAWWEGCGAVRVLARWGAAVLMERATGTLVLADLARTGGDDVASGVLCDVAARLHAPRDLRLPSLVPLRRWFAALPPAASRHGGVLVDAAGAAESLLADPRDVVVLHGDLHHGNVLDGGTRGWRAIDPKGLVGERGFDFANLFCNPDAAVALAPGRLARQARVVANAADLDRERLLRWVLAYAGLSAAWFLEDGDDPALPLAVAALARAELGADAT